MHVSKLRPNDVLVVDGPAIIHLHPERGMIIAATDAPDTTGIAKIEARAISGVKKRLGADAAAIVRDFRNQRPHG